MWTLEMYMQGIYPALEGRGRAKLPQIKFHFLKCSPCPELTCNPSEGEGEEGQGQTHPFRVAGKQSSILKGICECP